MLLSTLAEVWGSPVTHSLSPALHRHAYAELGLDWVYERREVGERDFLAQWTARQGCLAGLSVTMPLKARAAQVADDRSDVVTVLGVANTLSRRAEGRWRADNTDATAMAQLLRDISGARAVVVGGGATAASAVWALAARGVTDVAVVTRRGPRDVVRDAARQLGVSLATVGWDDRPAADVLVLAVPGAARDAWLARQASALPATGTVLDVAYDTGTGALDDLTARGWSVSTGLDLLVAQAAEQVFLMTGRRVSADALRPAVTP